MTTDIMMVTYNRIELTKKTLNSIIETTTTPYNLIIVDNASVDGTQDYLEKFCQEHSNKDNFISYKIKLNKENKGIAIGRNQALLLSEHEWLSTVDNDVILPNNWLGQCIEILQKNKNYGMIGVNFEKANFPLMHKDGLVWQYKHMGNLGAACTVFNRSLHKKIGFFNTSLEKYGHEDADFGARVRAIRLEMGYLKENGIHLGEGVEDTGEYRKFKDEFAAKNLPTYKYHAIGYMNGSKPVYIPFNYVD